jgi:hypothetical protein
VVKTLPDGVIAFTVAIAEAATNRSKAASVSSAAIRYLEAERGPAAISMR